MKKLKIWHLMMLSIFALLTMVACGSEDDINSDISSLTSANLTEDGYFDGILYYQITSNSPNEVAVNKSSKTAAKVEIPAQVNIEGKNYKCTSIGKKAFDGCRGLLSIKIGRYVESISANAFMSCNTLEEISVDKSNAIYDSRDNCNAIIDTRHNSIILGCKRTSFPKSVYTIGSFAFYGRSGLVKLDLPDNILYIGQMAFQNCVELTETSILASCIDAYAFYGCSKLKSVDLGIYMMLIGEYAFKDCDNLFTVRCLRERGIPHIGCNLSFNEGERPQGQPTSNIIWFSDEGYSCFVTWNYRSSLYAFDHDTYMRGTLYVARGLGSEYGNDQDWGRFEKIKEENK